MRNRGFPRPRKAARLGMLAVTLSAFALLGGCDYFDVTNPGPVQDKFLDSPKAAQAIVNGAHRRFNDAWNEIVRGMSSTTREVFPSGNTGTVGITAKERQGLLDPQEQSTDWNWAHEARWVAEDALQRFKRGGGAPAAITAEAHLWAGYANRLLGENFCQAVIDGGSPEPHTAYLERAETHFTEAMEIARSAGETGFARAALGARASVRVNLDDWSGAAADAEALLAEDPDFFFQTDFSASDRDQYNLVFFSSENAPYRVHTTWNTFYEDYYRETDDPRTPWTTLEGYPEGSFAVGPFGKVPWLPQRKFDSRTSPLDLTDAREMRLILAEAALVDGRWQEAMDIINNDLRATVPGADLAPWEANSLDEAWTAFMKERGIELWLEGRRAADRRRWAVSADQPWELAVPGELDPHEVPSTTAPEHERGAGTYLSPNMTMCMPIPDSERETNPNVPNS